VAAVTAGAARMPWPRFAVANATGAVAWATTVATLAVLAGPTGSLLLAAGGLTLGAITLAGGVRSHRRTLQQAA
jgi:membrane protein DedA with SNARE-associated domain